MKIIKILVFGLVCLIHQSLYAQNPYWVFLTDKSGEKFEPYTYFDSMAIERRWCAGIPLSDISDYPVNAMYVSEIASIVQQIGTPSRWFNAVPVLAFPSQIKLIETLPFVQNIEPMCTDFIEASVENDDPIDGEVKNLLNQAKQQVDFLGISQWEKAGINGKGIRIAIFDGGFPGVETSAAFEHIRKEGRIKATWDFTRNKDNVYHGISHGTNVMSNIAGIWEGQPIGLATGAEFILAKTEVRSEPFFEEENWLAAVEWADKNGAQIINSSLGYTYHRYFNYQMDGKTSLVARAANMAARKGILVVNAAGNEGSGRWKFIGTPADADSVLSVGGIDPNTGIHINFSSYGPTSDKRLKPNVCTFGSVVVAGKKGLHNSQGTSFASPLVAGFAACAWQAHPEYSNMQLFKQLEMSGSLYPYFDYAHGYGVPQASYFLAKQSKPDSIITLSDSDKDCEIVLAVSNTFSGNINGYLFCHIQKPDGSLSKYYVVQVNYQSGDDKNIFSIPREEYQKGDIIRASFKGFTTSIKIQ